MPQFDWAWIKQTLTRIITGINNQDKLSDSLTDHSCDADHLKRAGGCSLEALRQELDAVGQRFAATDFPLFSPYRVGAAAFFNAGLEKFDADFYSPIPEISLPLFPTAGGIPKAVAMVQKVESGIKVRSILSEEMFELDRRNLRPPFLDQIRVDQPTQMERLIDAFGYMRPGHVFG